MDESLIEKISEFELRALENALSEEDKKLLKVLKEIWSYSNLEVSNFNNFATLFSNHYAMISVQYPNSQDIIPALQSFAIETSLFFIIKASLKEILESLEYLNQINETTPILKDLAPAILNKYYEFLSSQKMNIENIEKKQFISLIEKSLLNVESIDSYSYLVLEIMKLYQKCRNEVPNEPEKILNSKEASRNHRNKVFADQLCKLLEMINSR